MMLMFSEAFQKSPGMKLSVTLLWTVCCIVNFGDCDKNETFRILGLFGHQGKSHFDVFAPLVEELARRGHEVTVLSHFPRKEKIPNYNDISLVDGRGIYVNIIDLNELDRSSMQITSNLRMLYRMAEKSCGSTYKIPAVQDLIKSDEKFDLIIAELFNTDCLLGFMHKFKAPYISLSSHQIMPWGNTRLNNPDNPSYIPSILNTASPNMNFIERVKNTLFVTVPIVIYEKLFTGPSQALVEENFGPDVPPLRDIANNVSAILVNTHFSLHGARPYVPGVVEVGGLHIRGNKPLPQDIQHFLDSAKDGVLYFSWGSMVKAATLPKDKLNTIVRALGNLKQKVIWKWEEDDLPNKPKNLMVQKWMPQFDILSHPNVKGFLTHGGLLGLSEGIYCGVPMVVVPMFGDQGHNAAAAAARGAAVILQYEDITEESLGNALNEILNNPSYRKNAQAVSEAYRDRPATALETAVWWSEYIARGKGLPFLRSASANLSWFQYHLLDVIAFLSLVTLVFLFVTVFAIKLIFRRLFGSKAPVVRTEKSNGARKNGVDKKRV